MTAGAFPPTAAEWDEQSRWDEYKQALDTVVGALAAPLSITEFVKGAQVIAAGSREAPRTRERQMQALRRE